MSFLTFLAQAGSTAVNTAAGTGPAGATPGGVPAPQWFQILAQYGPIIAIVLLFYFFVMGSKRKQDRERKTLLENLKKNDQVRMIGGEYGTVVDVRGTKVLVKVDESSNTKILYARDAVQAVETKDAPAKDEVTK